jgi:hypothetical protein
MVFQSIQLKIIEVLVHGTLVKLITAMLTLEEAKTTTITVTHSALNVHIKPLIILARMHHLSVMPLMDSESTVDTPHQAKMVSLLILIPALAILTTL